MTPTLATNSSKCEPCVPRLLLLLVLSYCLSHLLTLTYPSCSNALLSVGFEGA